MIQTRAAGFNHGHILKKIAIFLMHETVLGYLMKKINKLGPILEQ
jgi:hypothetical protein